jgi:hypothetical protein
VIPWKKNVNPVSMPHVTYVMMSSRKSPEIMRFLMVLAKWIRTPVNRIVIIASWKKSPIVPGVKLSWRSAKTAAGIKRADSGSADPADQPDLSRIFLDSGGEHLQRKITGPE